MKILRVICDSILDNGVQDVKRNKELSSLHGEVDLIAEIEKMAATVGICEKEWIMAERQIHSLIISQKKNWKTKIEVAGSIREVYKSYEYQ